MKRRHKSAVGSSDFFLNRRLAVPAAAVADFRLPFDPVTSSEESTTSGALADAGNPCLLKLRPG